MDRQLFTGFLDGHDFHTDFDSHPEALCPGHQLMDKIRIKSLKGPLAAVQNRDLGARPCRDMSELKGDIPAPDENDALRQRFQLQELIVRCDVLLSRNTQPARHCPGCNNHMTTTSTSCGCCNRGNAAQVGYS